MVMATKDRDDLCYSLDPRDNEGTLCGGILEDHAHTWWKTTVRRYDGRPALTWANFRKEFEEKYYSQALRDKKWTEFMNLKQGGMTVESMSRSLVSYQNLLRLW